jgi:hypothetical protein
VNRAQIDISQKVSPEIFIEGVNRPTGIDIVLAGGPALSVEPLANAPDIDFVLPEDAAISFEGPVNSTELEVAPLQTIEIDVTADKVMQYHPIEQYLPEVIEYLENPNDLEEIYLGDVALSEMAAADHNHDEAYAPIAHNHDEAYAAIAHDHDETYAPIVHDHGQVNMDDVVDGLTYVKTENNLTDALLADLHAPGSDNQAIPEDVSDLTDITNLISGKKPFHGIESYAPLSWSDGDKRLSITAIAYWYQGVRFSTAETITCDLDLTADRDNSANTITANTLYFFYFKDATGKLYWSDSPWNFRNNVFVATVFWNGTSGACQLECHGHQRDIDWHLWAHDTIGTRFESGAQLTYPTTASDGLLQVETGFFHDEDIDYEIGQCTTMRGWRKTASNQYTFANYSLPYVGTAGQPQWLDTDDYTLKNVAASDFVRMWVYASLDISTPIYIIPTHRSTAYNTIIEARNEAAPVTIGTNINSEYKLIYCFIYKGDGQLQEIIDYRSTSPVPGGGTPSLAASQVTFAVAGDISSTNVQAAIEELDTEKAALVHASRHAVGGADAVFPADPNADKYLKWNNSTNLLEWADAGGSFSGDMDDIADGTTYVKTENNYTDADSSKLAGIEAAADVTDATNVAAAGAVMETNKFTRGHIWGLTMSNAADTVNDITIAAGEARDEAGTADMVLASAITKRLDAAWAVGTDQGGLNTGSVAASTWYEVILIKRTDTGVVDVMFSTTANRTTLPANYTKYRRIGWIRTDAGAAGIKQFVQVDDHFTWVTQVNDVAASKTATATAVTLTAPPNSIARFRATADMSTSVNANSAIVFSEIVEENVTPAIGTGIASLGYWDLATGASAGHFELRVSSTSTIEHDASVAVGAFDISTFGFIDHRCRLSNT